MSDRPIFLVPSLAPINGQTDSVAVDAGYSGEAEFGFTTEVTIRLLAMQLTPAIRALVLAGYEATGISYTATLDGSVTDWLHLDLGTNTFTSIPHEEPISELWIGDMKVAAIIEFEPRYHFMEPEFSFAIPFDDETGKQWYVETDSIGSGSIVLSSEEGVSGALEGLPMLLKGQASFIDEMVARLVSRWDPGSLDPDASAGMLWLFDPDEWQSKIIPIADMESSAYTVAADLARSAFHSPGNEKLPVEEFIRGQVDGTGTLATVLVGAPVDPSVATSRRLNAAQADTVADNFFRAMDEWLETYQGRTGPLDTMIRESLPTLGWFDVLMILTQEGVIAPDGLPLGEGYGDEEEPLDVVQNDSETEIEITVLKRDTVTLKLASPVVVEEYNDGVAVQRNLSISDCVAWEFASESPDGTARLIIVAAPGVWIYAPEAQLTTWTLEIFRVQDYGLVPEPDSRIDTGLLLTSYVIPFEWPEHHDDLWAPDAAYWHGMQVNPQPSGVILRYPLSDDGGGDPPIPHTIAIEVDPYRGDQRYSFDVEFFSFTVPDDDYFDWEFFVEGKVGTTIKVWISGEVTVNYSTNVSDMFAPFEWVTYYGKKGSINDLAPPGVPLARPAESEVFTPSNVAIDYTSILNLAMDVTDVAVGFIPYVGDAVDAAEFAKGCVTGTDKWGRPLTRLDLIFMGAGVCLPFVSSGFVKGLGRNMRGLLP